MKNKLVYKIALFIAIIGALNWGFGAFNYNLIQVIFGSGIWARLIYGLVGISGILLTYRAICSMTKR